MTKLKLATFIGILVFLFGIENSVAQLIFTSVRISSTFNPVGSGARAMGMGGAFIAVADDATAASWNPGGLIQLETPEVSIVYSFIHWREDYKSPSHPEAEGMNEKYADDLNYFSAALPFQFLGRNFVASLNFQRLYDMYKNLTFEYNYSGIFSNGNPWHLNLHQRFKQNGGIKAFAPAIAFQVTPRFSIGATFNIWTDKLFWNNQWSETTHARGQGAIGPDPFETDTFIYEKFSDFEGFNMNLGFLWDVNRKITIGGVFKTPFTADLTHHYYFTSTQTYPTLNASATNEFSPSLDKMKLKMPASFGFGIAFRLSDAFTYSFDIYRTMWSDFFREIKGYPEDYSDIDNRLRSQSNVHDTTQIRTGMEYLFILEKTLIPLRGGLFLDPRPSHKSSHTFWGFSVGSGFMIGKLVIDYAYQFRTGDDVEGGVLGIPNTKADVDQHTIYLSAIYHFE